MNKQFKPGDAVIVDAGLGITKNGNIQRIAETVAYVKHYNGSVVGYKYEMIKPVVMAEQAQKPYGVGLTSELSMIQSIMEKKLTPAEMKKREEIAQAMERENPGMDMSKKMAIATATAKKVAEEVVEEAMDHSKMTDAELKKHINTRMKNAVAHNLSPKASATLNAAQAELKRRKATQVAEDTEQIDEKLTDDAKKKINTALGPKFANNTLRQTSGPARAIIGLAKTNPDNIVKKEDMHYCAKHIFSERFGEGLVVEGSHAEPTAEGLIEWYDVDFGGTVRRVMTEKVKVMHAEYHMNHKKKMKEEVEEAASHQASATMKHVKDATPGEKKAAKDIKPGIAGYRDRVAMLKSAQADGRLKEGKAHTVPKTAKEKDLAALAEPKDKITHADVMVGRGVKKEEVELDEGFENLPGKATHLTKVDVRHPEHGIISGSTTLRHLGGNKYEVRAGRAKGKTIALDDKHVQKLSMEEVELDEAMISYSDFQSKIKAHQKAGNQIKDDKYDKKKASYTVIDQEGTAKKITHTDSGVSQQHLGSVKRDDDESSETKPTEKRGRGRPAGSKSGARN
jgi:hypothetical protein